MTLLHWQAISGVLLLLLFLVYGQLRHWRATADGLEREIDIIREERCCDGWQSETRFLRRIVNEDAAEWAEENS